MNKNANEDVQDVIVELLKKQFGVKLNKINFKRMGKNRIYAFKPCDLDIQEKHSGIYFGTIEKDGFRLSIEGSYIVGREAKKGVIEVKSFRSGRGLARDREKAARYGKSLGLEEVTLAVFVPTGDEEVLAALSGEEEIDGVTVRTVAIGWE